MPDVELEIETETGTGLVKWDSARTAIAECKTVDEIKFIRNKAEAMRAYAKQIGESLGVQNDLAEIKIRAERKAGELINEMDLSKGGRPSNQDDSQKDTNVVNDTKTYKELGITSMQSQRWRDIAYISEEDFESKIVDIKSSSKELTSSDIIKVGARLRRSDLKSDREMERVEEAKSKNSPDIEIIHGDFRNIILKNKVDCVITDPPYLKEYISLYSDISEFCFNNVKEGGNVIVMVGHRYLPEYLNRLSEKLHYKWTLSLVINLLTPIWVDNISSRWKPIIWMTNGESKWERTIDTIISKNQDKELHEWQQSLESLTSLVSMFSSEGQTVLDMMCGAGTTGLACLELKRKFIGIDIDERAIDITKKRLGLK